MYLAAAISLHTQFANHCFAQQLAPSALENAPVNITTTVQSSLPDDLRTPTSTDADESGPQSLSIAPVYPADPFLQPLSIDAVEVPEFEFAELAQAESDQIVTIESTAIHTSAQETETLETQPIEFGDWLGYNSTKSDTTWLIANGDNLGIFSMESFPTLSLTDESSIETGTGFHFLNGPVATDMPPRLFDFQIAAHSRATQTKNFIFDLKLGIGVFSDFEGSARKGVRFPGHAVAYYQWNPCLVSVLGIESLDRDDVSVLPVAGWVWRPREDLVLDLIFPRPKAQVKISPDNAMYISGELGGGTWAIERVTGLNDVATYRDLRMVLGIVDLDDDDDSALEIGWAFARALEYRSGLGNYHPDDSFILRFRSLY